VFNDNAYGNVLRLQRDAYGGRVLASELVNPDYQLLAKAFGVTGRYAETPDQLRVQLREAIKADEPTLIEVPVGPMPDQFKALGVR
jgi:acetolactate synthase-1/2/3 large subunit